MLSLSKNEDLILLALWQLQDEAHGSTIRTYLCDKTGYEWSIAGVYAPLKRLASQGLVSTYVGEPTHQREGRCKRHYKLTQKGLGVLSMSEKVHASMWKDLPNLSFDG